MLIIDCHGHYTTAPAAHQKFRDQQLARLANPALPAPRPEKISDDAIRESIETNQLKLQQERGADLTIFSPRASAMNRSFNGGSLSTALIPNRRTALAVRPGMPNSRVRVSVAAATMNVSSPRQRW